MPRPATKSSFCHILTTCYSADCTLLIPHLIIVSFSFSLFMENSVSSYPNKLISSTKTDNLSEESGWTQYLDDDLIAYDKDDELVEEFSCFNSSSGCSSFMQSASMVSDAGSAPEWKRKTTVHHLAPTDLPNMPKKLNFKNKKTQQISYDDSLEDTASSPVNSPKIATYFKKMDLNSRKVEKANGSPMGNKSKISDMNGEDELKGSFGNEVEYTELKQKGMCLVPISMVLNYLN
ncbi:vascular-related unknown protein 1 isoform X2 [Amaranthus tricolor]|uniref:vascular-related unknown protein 1 isoform X2 n=1 Tax=Amaranthus tricolor TaxID=29722 RepID=UPI0025838F6F|nr:vascular-related unknown protein 1 isoform X2 [Amaranthus tricolor]